MADLRTTIQKTLRLLSLDNETEGAVVEDDVRIAIIDAMEDSKHFSFWFNQAKGTVITVAEQDSYFLPKDFISMVGVPVLNSSQNAAATRRRLQYMPIDWCIENKWRGKDTEMTLNTGDPEIYSIEPMSNKMLLIPVPSESDDEIEYTYTRSCSIPYYIHDGQNWKFYKNGSSVELDDDFKNPWLEFAHEMIVYRAAYKLLTGYYGGTGESEQKAQACLSTWMDLLNTKRAEHTRRGSPKGITRWI
jgi:hypothetical protein